VSRTTFNCPFCCSDLPLQASVCGHCTRDLALFKPLALQLHELTDQIDQLKALVQAQKDDIEAIKAHDIGSLASAFQADRSARPEPPTTASGHTVQSSWLTVWLMALLTVAAVGLSHWVLLFVYDAPPLALRLLTITLPVLTGYVCARKSGKGLVGQLLAALFTGFAAVCLMLWITATIDAVPLWPNNPREWKETFEYVAAISLAFFTGHLIHRLMTHWAEKRSNRISLSVLLERDQNGQFKIAEITSQVHNLITAMAPVVSAGTALYSGLKIFTGD